MVGHGALTSPGSSARGCPGCLVPGPLAPGGQGGAHTKEMAGTWALDQLVCARALLIHLGSR